MDVESESAASCQEGTYCLSCWRQKVKQWAEPADNQRFNILTFAKAVSLFQTFNLVASESGAARIKRAHILIEQAPITREVGGGFQI